MKTKKRVALIYGGPSAEYDVSLKTATAVRDNLDPESYDVQDVHISKDGWWHLDDRKLSEADALKALQDVDVAFLAVHGSFGEDGTLQQILADHNIAFTGSEAQASHTAMDKDLAGKAFEKAGLRVPKSIVVTDETSAASQSEDLSLPFVVKPVSQGSSIGITIVKNREQLAAALKLAFAHDTQVMLQEFISGREVSCGVLEDAEGTIVALPPTEMIATNGADFFDYDAKYTPGSGQEITPPDLPDEVIKQIQEIASVAHQCLGCRGYSRTDTIVRDDEIFVIEINTLPGLTSASILPQQAAAAGISFPELLDKIIASAQ